MGGSASGEGMYTHLVAREADGHETLVTEFVMQVLDIGVLRCLA